MIMQPIEIDWNFFVERVERLMDLGEEFLTRKLAEVETDPALFRTYIALRWHPDAFLEPIAYPDIPSADDLLGIDRILQRLQANTRQFVAGHPANNVLLWGERGTGKSSAVKSLLGLFAADGLRLVEVRKEDLYQLPVITAALRREPFRFIVFCDDLSFDESEPGYRELKALLEGGLEAPPPNVLFYATANRRHLMPERFEDNSGEAEIHPEEAVSEKLSLSDRFGLAFGFYPMGQELYLEIVHHLAELRQLQIGREDLDREALQWALQRGASSGRVARQFADDLTGRLALEGRRGG